MIAYLDIETSFGGDVTVVGIMRGPQLVQLVGDVVRRSSLEPWLRGIDEICTFNGEFFDLPVLRRKVGVDLLERCRSLDLWTACRREGLRGGLKRIEAQLGIARGEDGIGGYDAMVLWERWRDGDREALETLLAYNRDDVENLAALEDRLRGDLQTRRPAEVVVIGPGSAEKAAHPRGSVNGTGLNGAASRSLDHAIR